MRYIFVVSYFMVIACLPFQANAVPEYWKKSAFAIECRDTTLKAVLEDFARSFGVQINISDRISGTCKGWKRAGTAEGFLNKLGNDYRFQWFVYQNTLYISANGRSKTARLNAEPGFKDTLIGLGLFQDKFGWGALPGDEAVIVTGPQKYIDIIRRLTYRQTQEKKREARGNVHIFKLQHAPVEDRTITVREGTVTIPGVVTILRGLFTGSDSVRNELRVNSSPDSYNEPSNLSRLNDKKDKIMVEADVRTNTILIRAPEKDHDFYQNIINNLDVPSKLIEIDAIIVDINRDDLREIGTDFSFTDHRDRGSFQTSTITGEALRTPSNASATILIKDLGLFQARLKALESKGDASIIANTSILTLENQPAVIDLSETVFLQSVGERVVDVRPVTAGTLLNVTPMFVVNDGVEKIKLEIDIEDGSLSSNQQSDIPRVKRTTINTKAIVDQDRSLVVGGYHVQKTLRQNSGVPLLKSVPALGKLFKTEVTQNSSLERLFILTPRISPTFHNPEDYSSTGSADLITKNMERIKKRWKRATQSYVEKTTHLLSELASNSIPQGYDLTTISESEMPFKCDQDSIRFRFEKGQKITGHGLTAYIGIVTNMSEKVLPVEEQSCRGSGLIGVSIFPEDYLDPSASSEIFISMESARISTPRKPTL